MKLLSLTVWITVCLLLLGSTLVVLGIFNQQLKWDIFSPQVEAFLYGVFFSCLLLSLFGVAIAFVLGLKRIVDAVEALERKGRLDASVVLPTRKLTYVGYMLGLMTAFAALIGGLSLINHQVQTHRSQVFKRIAGEQLQKFDNKFIPPLTQLRSVPPNTAPKFQSVAEIMTALKELSFVREATLYVPDRQDQAVLWRYNPYQVNAKGDPYFQRFLIVKTFEEAIAQALNGNPKPLVALNGQTQFEWYHILKNKQGQSLGVLKIYGNPNENFREYRLGSSAIP
ncbi:MAG: hypothetical protein WCD18_27950 [Thermosynechococcaceae cyanobacterium]